MKVWTVLDVNDCETEQCSFGTCADRVDSFSCSCNPGYTGVRCDTGNKAFALLYLLNILYTEALGLSQHYCPVNSHWPLQDNMKLWESLNLIYFLCLMLIAWSYFFQTWNPFHPLHSWSLVSRFITSSICPLHSLFNLCHTGNAVFWEWRMRRPP